MAFIRTREDFICENCRIEVAGNGYTNHCPKCLWSKHVDIEPGDRSETCAGLMEPVGLEKNGDEYSLIHHCEHCHVRRKNKVASEQEVVIFLQK